jgi:predicted ATP-dependent serine protease
MNSQKTETVYVCSNCGQDFAKWQGKCTDDRRKHFRGRTLIVL